MSMDDRPAGAHGHQRDRVIDFRHVHGASGVLRAGTFGHTELLATMPEALEQMAKMRRFQRRWMRINWHMNAHESATMWDLYARAGQGVAIGSTYERLRDAFAPAGQDVMIGTLLAVPGQAG